MFHAAKVTIQVVVLALLVAACSGAQPTAIRSPHTQPVPVQPSPVPSVESQQIAVQPAMPNPASVFCEEQGGRLEIRTDASGSQAGVCLFQDGSECDEWAFFRGECQPGGPGTAASLAPSPRYINDSFGFSFDPPSDWSIEEYPDYLIFRRPGYKMFVGYQWANEAPKPFRTGMPAGDFVDGGSSSLMGQPVSKQILVRDGRNKVVAYNGRIKVGDLILVMYLDAEETAEVSYDSLDIPPEIIAEADQIISSFVLTSGETPQLEFNP